MERTLSIVKPDGVSQGVVGEVIKRFEAAGLKIIAMKMLHLNKQGAEGFYAVHQGKPFFDSLINFITSGPIVAMVLEGEEAIRQNRKLMGATNPNDADRGTIRKDFASSIEKNIVHGSDAPDTAIVEITYFFNMLELFDYQRT